MRTTYIHKMTKTPLGDGRVELAGPCLLTGETHKVVVNADDLARVTSEYSDELVQTACPYLSRDDQDFLILGVAHGRYDEFRDQMPDSDEDDDPPPTSHGPLWDALHKLLLRGGWWLELTSYANGRPCVFVFNVQYQDNAPECCMTHNLPDDPLEADEFHVRFADRESLFFQDLIESGIARPTGKIVAAGLVERYAEVWQLLTPESR